jgi:leucyl-tRNA synthetase
LRGLLIVPPGSGQDVVVAAAMALPAYAEWTTGKTIRKTIFVPDQLVNFVVG